MRENTIALYQQIVCAYNYGAGIDDLCEAFQRKPCTIYAALEVHGAALPQKSATSGKRAAAIAAYEGGATGPQIGKWLGVTRERVYQYLRPGNHISLRAERDKMVREALKTEQSALVATAREEHQAKLTAGMELVRGGLSYPKACRCVGLIFPGATLALAKVCRDAGIVNMNGRHRRFQRPHCPGA
jgi:hypothetical protein